MWTRIAIVVICAGLAACQAGGAPPTPTHSPQSSTERHYLSENEKSQVRKGVLQSLKDPESARFSETFAASKDADGVVTVCGYINARNSFGGYTGDQPFIGVLTTDSFVPVAFGSSDTKRIVVLNQCKRTGVI